MEYGQNYSYIEKRSSGMATASLVLGILSLVLACCIYPAFIFGSLAIALALLSRGGEMTMSGMAKAGLILGIVAISCLALYLVFTLFIIYVEYGGFEGYLNYIYDLMDQMYPGYSDLYRGL